VAGDHPGLLAARDREVESDPKPMRAGPAGAEHPECRRDITDAEWLVFVLDGLQGEVVTEPPRLLMGVGVAAHVHQ
jgi:hypothetical protein